MLHAVFERFALEMIEALAGYYSAQVPGRGRSGDAAEIARGADIYAKGVAEEGIPPCR